MSSRKSRKPASNSNKSRDPSVGSSRERDDKYRINKLIKALTTTGLDTLELKYFEELKTLCLQSDENIQYTYSNLLKTLHKDHSQIRLSGLQICDQLLRCSKPFRNLLIEDLRELFSLVIAGSPVGSSTPLPPPKCKAELLSRTAFLMIKQWHELFGNKPKYFRLKMGFTHVCAMYNQEESLPLQELNTFTPPSHNSQIHLPLQLPLSSSQANDVLLDEVNVFQTQLDGYLEDMTSTMTELESCLSLLMPTPDDFLIEDKEDKINKPDLDPQSKSFSKLKHCSSSSSKCTEKSANPKEKCFHSRENSAMSKEPCTSSKESYFKSEKNSSKSKEKSSKSEEKTLKSREEKSLHSKERSSSSKESSSKSKHSSSSSKESYRNFRDKSSKSTEKVSHSEESFSNSEEISSSSRENSSKSKEQIKSSSSSKFKEKSSSSRESSSQSKESSSDFKNTSSCSIACSSKSKGTYSQSGEKVSRSSRSNEKSSKSKNSSSRSKEKSSKPEGNSSSSKKSSTNSKECSKESSISKDKSTSKEMSSKSNGSKYSKSITCRELSFKSSTSDNGSSGISSPTSNGSTNETSKSVCPKELLSPEKCPSDSCTSKCHDKILLLEKYANSDQESNNLNASKDEELTTNFVYDQEFERRASELFDGLMEEVKEDTNTSRVQTLEEGLNEAARLEKESSIVESKSVSINEAVINTKTSLNSQLEVTEIGFNHRDKSLKLTNMNSDGKDSQEQPMDIDIDEDIHEHEYPMDTNTQDNHMKERNDSSMEICLEKGVIEEQSGARMKNVEKDLDEAHDINSETLNENAKHGDEEMRSEKVEEKGAVGNEEKMQEKGEEEEGEEEEEEEEEEGEKDFNGKHEPGAILREMGILFNTNITITLPSDKITIAETPDNCDILENARGNYNLMKRKYLPLLTKWNGEVTRCKLNQSGVHGREMIRKYSNVRDRVVKLIEKYEKINFVRSKSKPRDVKSLNAVKSSDKVTPNNAKSSDTTLSTDKSDQMEDADGEKSSDSDSDSEMEEVEFEEVDMLPIVRHEMSRNITSAPASSSGNKTNDSKLGNSVKNNDSKYREMKKKQRKIGGREWRLGVDEAEAMDPTLGGHQLHSLITSSQSVTGKHSERGSQEGLDLISGPSCTPSKPDGAPLGPSSSQGLHHSPGPSSSKELHHSPGSSREGPPSSVYGAFSERKRKLLALAPKLPYDTDLYHWEDEALPVPRLLPNSTEGHRFWASSALDDTEGIPLAEGAALYRTRVIEFSGEHETRDDWPACNVPLPSGKLCPRRDKVKCPFHGIIYPRDSEGKCLSPEDEVKWQRTLEEKRKNQVPDWQDPVLLRELKAVTGVDLTMPKKGQRKRRGPGPGLVPLAKPQDTPAGRIKKKIFHKRALKRVANALDRIDQRKFRDKYGDQFNYT